MAQAKRSSATTRSELRRKKLLILMPSFALALALSLNAWFGVRYRVLQWPLFFVFMVVTPLAGLAIGVAVRDRKRTEAAPSEVIFASFGRFFYYDAIESGALSSIIGHLKPPLLGKGWIEGTLWITARSWRFLPGKLSTRSGFRPFEIEFRHIADLEFHVRPIGMGASVTMTFLDRTRLSWEVRGSRALRGVLESGAIQLRPSGR